VAQHELFHFRVVGAAPVGPGQERPPDFDLAYFFVVSVEARRPDDPAIPGIDNDQRSTRFQGLAEEFLEYGFLVTVSDRMLFPDERIRRHAVQLVPIFRSQRP